MNASQCSQLDSQLASGALLGLCGEPLGLVEYAGSYCIYSISISVVPEAVCLQYCRASRLCHHLKTGFF